MTDQKLILVDDDSEFLAVMVDDISTQLVQEYKSRKGMTFDRNRIILSPEKTEMLRKFLNRCDIANQYQKYAEIIKEK